MRLQKYNFFLSITIRSPIFFVYTLFFVDEACADKQKVGQAVHECQRRGAHGECLAHGCDEPFGTAADGAAHVALSSGDAPSGEHEGAQGGELGVGGVDECLEV